MLAFVVAMAMSLALADDVCHADGFTIGASHMTHSIAEPFVVRELRGRFVPDFTDDTGWAEGMMKFQVIGPTGTRIDVPIAADGSFGVADLPAGRYRFRSASESYQGYEGTIILDPNAEPGEIVISVAMGA